MKKHEVIDTVRTNYRALEAMCGQAGLDRLLDRLLDTCERLEKGRNPKRQHTLSTAAMYFAVKVCASRDHYKPENEKVSARCATLAYLAGCREDYQIGAMLGAALEQRGFAFKPTAEFGQLDYCEHFAGKEA